MAESKRTFLAVHFSKELIEALAALQNDLRSNLAETKGVKWVQPENIHLTIQFLGQVDNELIPILAGELKEAMRTVQPFSVSLNGVGAFPSRRRPRVIWAGFEKGKNKLVGLFRTVQAVTRDQGFEPEKRPFNPHVTLGRIKNAKKIYDMSSVLARFEEQRWGGCQINELALMASKLTPKGPIYTVLDSLQLGQYDTEHMNR